MIKISLKFVPKGPINNIPAFVRISAWRCPGDKPLSEPMMVSLPMDICVTQPQRALDKYNAFDVPILLQLYCVSVNPSQITGNFIVCSTANSG